MQGYKSHELLFKRGSKGTDLEKCELLIWVQIITVLLLGIGMSVYACIYLSLILPRVFSPQRLTRDQPNYLMYRRLRNCYD
jgi:hypothetical protein